METNLMSIDVSKTKLSLGKRRFKLASRFSDFQNRTILFRFGPFIFATYGLLAALAFLVGGATIGVFGSLMGLDPVGLLAFSSLVVAPAVLIGSRVFSVLLEWRGLFTRPIQTLLKPGYMLHGGVLGGAIAIFVYSRVTQTNLFLLTDAFALAMPIGEAIQRIGCHVYGCCWGKPTNSNFGISYTSPHSKVARAAPELIGKRLYPVQLFGSAAHFGQFTALAALVYVLPFSGFLTGLYLVTHPIIRVVLEQFRKDDRGKLIGPLTHTNLYSAIQFVVGAAVLGGVFSVGEMLFPAGLDTLKSAFTEPALYGFLFVSFSISALAFGVHFQSVGNWYTPKPSIVLNRSTGKISRSPGALAPQEISNFRK